MRPCIVVEQSDPTGEFPWSLRFDHLVKDGQGFQVMMGIHFYPTLQEVYQKGAILYVNLRFEGTPTSQVIGAHNEWWLMMMMIMMAKWYSGTLGPKSSRHLGVILVKEEHQHNLSCTCVDGLGFFIVFLVVVTLDASTGDFVVSILFWSDDTKTHLRPPLVPGTHSLPWYSAADYQYNGPFDMLPLEDCRAPIGHTLCTSSAFPSWWCEHFRWSIWPQRLWLSM